MLFGWYRAAVVEMQCYGAPRGKGFVAFAFSILYGSRHFLSDDISRSFSDQNPTYNHIISILIPLSEAVIILASVLSYLCIFLNTALFPLPFY